MVVARAGEVTPSILAEHGWTPMGWSHSAEESGEDDLCLVLANAVAGLHEPIAALARIPIAPSPTVDARLAEALRVVEQVGSIPSWVVWLRVGGRGMLDLIFPCCAAWAGISPH